MENALTCVLTMGVTFLVSFYAARGCLWGIIRLICGRGVGSNVRGGSASSGASRLTSRVMMANRRLAESPHISTPVT